MPTEIKSWLYDILSSIAEIDLFVPQGISLEVYSDDLKTKRAVERNLEIIGEALNRIVKK